MEINITINIQTSDSSSQYDYDLLDQIYVKNH